MAKGGKEQDRVVEKIEKDLKPIMVDEGTLDGKLFYKFGKALIFTYWADRDNRDLTAVLESMNVDVEFHKSHTESAIIDTMNSLNVRRLRKYDYFIIVILTQDIGKEISNAELYRMLKMPLFQTEELQSKLKWIIVEGFIDHNTLPYEEFNTNEYLISYASSNGIIPYQHEKEGRIYIQVLCDHLRRLASTCGLQEILAKIAENVPKKLEELKIADKKITNTAQIPKYETNLDSEFYFTQTWGFRPKRLQNVSKK